MRRQAGFFSRMELQEVPVELNRIIAVVEDAHLKYMSMWKVINSDSLYDVLEHLEEAKKLVEKGIIDAKKYRSKTAFIDKMVEKALLWNDVRKMNVDIKLLEKTVEDIQEVIMVVNGDFEKSLFLDKAVKHLVVSRDLLKKFFISLIKLRDSI